MQRFLSLDPLAADYPSLSDYVYVAGNPIFFIDPTGKSVDDHYVDKEGNYLGQDGNKDDHTVRVVDASTYNSMSEEQRNSKGGTTSLQASSTKLTEYTEGIRIGEGAWGQVESAGGQRVAPSVINNSSETAFFKPETTQFGLDNSGAYPIAPNTDLYVPVDGVSSPSVREGEVFKGVTGTQMTVTDTDITATTTGTKQAIGQTLKGGWKGASWNKNLNTPVAPQSYPGCCGSQGGTTRGRPGDTR